MRTTHLCVGLFANVKGQILVLDHVLNLATHSQSKEQNKVHEEDWPEDGNVKDGKDGADETAEHRADGTVPKLELWQATNEGTELVDPGTRGEIAGQGARIPRNVIQIRVIVQCRGVLGKRRIKLGTQKEQKDVEEIDAQSVGDHVEALIQDDAQHKDTE